MTRSLDPIGLKPSSPNRHPHPANGMFAQVHVGDDAWMTIIDPRSFEDGGAEWVMRYGDPEGIRYSVASGLASYDYLLCGEITTTEAVRRLRIMRNARAEAAKSETRP